MGSTTSLWKSFKCILEYEGLETVVQSFEAEGGTCIKYSNVFGFTFIVGPERNGEYWELSWRGVAWDVPGCSRVWSSVTLACVLQGEAQLENQHQGNEESVFMQVCVYARWEVIGWSRQRNGGLDWTKKNLYSLRISMTMMELPSLIGRVCWGWGYKRVCTLWRKLFRTQSSPSESLSV